MTKFVALLRGVNVGGKNLVGMEKLRDVLGKMGMKEVRSLLASGNVVFECASKSCEKLEKVLEGETLKRFGVGADFVVRTGEEWGKVVEGNPFTVEVKKDPGHLVVMFFKKGIGGKEIEALGEAVKGREVFRVNGRELYVVYRDGIGRSKFSNAVIERKLGMRGTMRNWNTVLKLAEMVSGE